MHGRKLPFMAIPRIRGRASNHNDSRCKINFEIKLDKEYCIWDKLPNDICPMQILSHCVYFRRATELDPQAYKGLPAYRRCPDCLNQPNISIQEVMQRDTQLQRSNALLAAGKQKAICKYGEEAKALFEMPEYEN